MVLSVFLRPPASNGGPGGIQNQILHASRLYKIKPLVVRGFVDRMDSYVITHDNPAQDFVGHGKRIA